MSDSWATVVFFFFLSFFSFLVFIRLFFHLLHSFYSLLTVSVTHINHLTCIDSHRHLRTIYSVTHDFSICSLYLLNRSFYSQRPYPREILISHLTFHLSSNLGSSKRQSIQSISVVFSRPGLAPYDTSAPCSLRHLHQPQPIKASPSSHTHTHTHTPQYHQIHQQK
ncbi:hypothetical protein BD289DRAFT_436722 [Coniella lustricola]|uniref:Uncharacterized protein n=1 Tax=Coniella lustricola TaxID=2025994 RepID=A0A2T3A4V8_9PEZI|nr:hypothetical protein BD289DRAFT_436722 [Coniella lustricola]